MPSLNGSGGPTGRAAARIWGEFPPSKSPALKAAVRAEQEAFRLKRELQRLDLEDPEPARRRDALGEVRRGGKVIDIDRCER